MASSIFKLGDIYYLTHNYIKVVVMIEYFKISYLIVKKYFSFKEEPHML